jgi:outer membrane protein assembly factor BamB
MTYPTRSLLILMALAVLANAGDWPMWRYDAARSAASPDAVATNLTLLWTRQLAPVRQAWPLDLEQRLTFDTSYEPVVMGQRLFLGSPNDGSVTAYDTGTGTEQWKFFTEGPVRCAPACANGRVYAGSDDGYLYCLDAQTGTLVWKLRGAPANRPDRKQLGNGHLVSFWPVRGGPVIADGIVYFGAGIWPVFGIFLHAVDAQTGKTKWTNGELNFIADVRLDHDNRHDSGLSPQGHFALIQDKLVVPCGRSMPAGLDVATGKLIYYTQGDKNGDSRVAAHGEYAFVGRNALVNVHDFREMGSKWAYAGTNAPAGYHPEVHLKLHRPDLFEAPDTRTFPYKQVEGCDAASAFENGVAYGASKGTFYAYDVAHARTAEHGVTRSYYMNVTTNFAIQCWEPPLRWEFKTPYVGQPGSCVVKAGRRLYGHAGKRLLAIENVEGTPRIAWEQNIAGTPSSLIAADGKLIVATAEGGLFCFGDGPTGRTHAAQTVPLETRNDDWTRKAQDLVASTGVKAGYALVLGLTEGRLIEELLQTTDLLLIGVDADAAKLERLRRRFDAAGLYGSRVELFVGAPLAFAFPPYLASLIVSEDSPNAGFSATTDFSTVFNWLRPYGGTLCIEPRTPMDTRFEKWAKTAGPTNAVVRQAANGSMLVRAGALPGSASWTHETADAAGTLCSQDDLVKAPLGVLWYGDALQAGREFVRNAALKKAIQGGRIFTLRETRAVLIAHDAYTGRFLWCHNVAFPLARMAAMPDGVYVAGAGKCLVCDPETGLAIQAFTFNTNGAPRVVDLRVDGESILLACSDVEANWYQTAGYADCSMLICLDRRTGVERWRRTAQHRFINGGIAVGADRVFFTDAPSHPQAKQAGLTNVQSTVFSLDLRTGAERWSRQTSYSRHPDDWLVYAPDAGVVLAGRSVIGNAWEAGSGKVLWTGKNVGSAPLIIRGQTFINAGAAVHDIATGEKTRQLPLGRAQYNFVGCNYPVAGRHLLMVRDCSAAYCDITDGTDYHLRNIRSGCIISLIAADGLLNAPNFANSCSCNYALQTAFAMVHMPEVTEWMGSTPVHMTPPPARPRPGTP